MKSLPQLSCNFLAQQKNIALQLPVKDCNRFKCFSSLSCEITSTKEILYYVYPPLKFIYRDNTTNELLIYDTQSMLSQEYWQVLSVILASSRLTLDPSQACILVPPVDLTWLSHYNVSILTALYASLPHWNLIDGKPGTNHMIVSLDPTLNPATILSAIGRAILVATNHNTWTARQQFDLNIPYIPRVISTPSLDGMSKEWKIITTQLNSLGWKARSSINRLEASLGSDLLVLGHTCSQSLGTSAIGTYNCDSRDRRGLSSLVDKSTCRCSETSGMDFKYPQILATAGYCLSFHLQDPPLGDSSQFLLYESLRWGCVPIVSSDFLLPFEGDIPWSEILFKLTNTYDLSGLIHNLPDVNSNKYLEMKTKGALVWKSHFHNYSMTVERLLEHYDSLVYPLPLLHQRQLEQHQVLNRKKTSEGTEL